MPRKWRGTNQILLSQRACVPTREQFLFLGGDIFDNQIWEPQIKVIVRTTTVKKKFSRINGMLRFPDWEKDSQIDKLYERNFHEDEVESSYHLNNRTTRNWKAYLKRVKTDNSHEWSLSRKELNTKIQSKSSQ